MVSWRYKGLGLELLPPMHIRGKLVYCTRKKLSKYPPYASYIDQEGRFEYSFRTKSFTSWQIYSYAYTMHASGQNMIAKKGLIT